jgi:hypothetical protein
LRNSVSRLFNEGGNGVSKTRRSQTEFGNEVQGSKTFTEDAVGAWADINYRGYWDVPRIFFVRHEGRLYLFDCCFDDELDDYPESFTVYQMPEMTEADYAGSWHRLSDKAICRIGEVLVASVPFDPTKRRQIDTAVFSQLTPCPAPTPG